MDADWKISVEVVKITEDGVTLRVGKEGGRASRAYLSEGDTLELTLKDILMSELEFTPR